MHMKKVSCILIGLLCLFIAAGLLLPAYAKLTDFGLLPKEALVSYTVGILLAATGIIVVFRGVFCGRKLEDNKNPSQ